MVQRPFGITSFALQCSTPDLKASHRHPRPDLRELHALISRSHKNMMSYLNAILDVLERHDSIADLLVAGGRVARWKNMFENLDHALSKRGGKVFE